MSLYLFLLLYVSNFLRTGEVICVRLVCVPSLLNKEVEMAGVLSSGSDDGWCKFGIKATRMLKNA